MEFLFGAGLVLLVLGGSTLGLIAFIQLQEQKKSVRALHLELASVRHRLRSLESGVDQPAQPLPDAADVPAENRPEPVRAPPAEASQPDPAPTAAAPVRRPPAEPRGPGPIERLLAQVRDNWMVWLGGISLGLAGIFLVIYSIEQGLLGPVGRILLGAIAGLAMQGGAEYLRRRTGNTSTVFAALAAAGSITLFATVLAALRLYDMVGVNTAFVLLTAVALTTMALALLHGPLLAALGLLGAYAVPAMVSTGEGNILVALVYSVIITGAAGALLRYVHREWLWWGVVIGAWAWWALSLGNEQGHGARIWYLTAVAYLLMAAPRFDWLMKAATTTSDSSYGPRNFWSVTPAGERNVLVLWLTLGAAQAITMLVEPLPASALVSWSPLLVLALVAARRREQLTLAPWYVLLCTLVAWVARYLDPEAERVALTYLPPEQTPVFVVYAAGTAVVTVGLSLWNFASSRFGAAWASLAALAPVLLTVTGYLITDYRADSWALTALFLGLTAAAAATGFVRRASLDSLVVWLYFSTHLAVASAAAIVFSGDTLTLVLASQAVSTAWLMRTFSVDLGWMIKLLAVVLVVRLTLNPWLVSYPTDSHWTLWTYGGSTLLVLAARWVLNQGQAYDKLRDWLEGVALHLAVLTLWTELRFWVHDGDVFKDALTAVEVSLYVVLFGAIAVVYHLRAGLSERLGWLYRIFAWLSATLALLSYLLILAGTVFDTRWLHGEVSQTPLFNLGLLFYALPVLVFFANYRFGVQGLRRAMLGGAVAGAFILVNLEIRHLWSDSFRLSGPTSDGEMVTYSVVWLLLAVATLVISSYARRSAATVAAYRGGMVLLALTIAKIFLIDMADLTGLLRVASFFGLGLALLGLSYLHQQLRPAPAATEAQDESVA